MEETPKIPSNDSIDAERPRILNIGCGKHKIPGAINLDLNPTADIVFDLETCGKWAGESPDGIPLQGQLPFVDNYFDIILASHTLEHIRNILPVMQELHRVAKPKAQLQIRVPYGGCSIAFEDPTHVRQFFPKSFEYFGQMAYNVADYGYRGDWEVVDMLLAVMDEFKGMPADELAFTMERAFNVVQEMFVVMEAIKPIRVADGVPRALKMKYGFVSDIQNGMMQAAKEFSPASNDPSLH